MDKAFKARIQELEKGRDTFKESLGKCVKERHKLRKALEDTREEIKSIPRAIRGVQIITEALKEGSDG